MEQGNLCSRLNTSPTPTFSHFYIGTIERGQMVSISWHKKNPTKINLVNSHLKFWHCTCDTSPFISVIIYWLLRLSVFCCSLPVFLWLSFLCCPIYSWKLTLDILFFSFLWVSTHTCISPVRQIVPVTNFPHLIWYFYNTKLSNENGLNGIT